MINVKKISSYDFKGCDELIYSDSEDKNYFNALGWSKNQVATQLEKNINYSYGAFYKKNLIALIIGDLIYVEKVSEYEILLIYVNKKYRNRGLASSLINNIFIQSSNLKLKKIFLEVAENNIPAIKMYEKNKFTLFNKRKNYYKIGDKKINALCYLKLI